MPSETELQTWRPERKARLTLVKRSCRFEELKSDWNQRMVYYHVCLAGLRGILTKIPIKAQPGSSQVGQPVQG